MLTAPQVFEPPQTKLIVDADGNLNVQTPSGLGHTLFLQGTNMDANCTVLVDDKFTWAVAQPPTVPVGNSLQTIAITVPPSLSQIGIVCDLKVINEDGSSTVVPIPLVFTGAVVNQIVAGPNSVLAADGLQHTLLIKGDQFVGGNTTVVITGPAGIQYQSQVFDKNTIGVTYTATQAGKYEVSVKTYFMSSPATGEFNLLDATPSVSQVSPTTITNDGLTAKSLQITGSDFQQGSAVLLIDANHIDAAHTQRLKDITVSADGKLIGVLIDPTDLAKLQSNSALLVVETPNNNEQSTPYPLTIVNAKPQITGLSQDATVAETTSNQSLTVYGSNFTPKTFIDFGTQQLIPTGAISSTQVSVTVPQALLASVGAVSVTADTPSAGGDEISNAVTFDVDDPSQSAITLDPTALDISPNASDIYVNGSNFNPGAVVEWNGRALATSYQGPTSLAATIPAGDLATAGTALIDVVNANPDGTPGATTQGATLTINNPYAVVVNNPPDAILGQDYEMTLTGKTDLVAGAAIQYNGNSYPLTQNGSDWKATIPAGDLVLPPDAQDGNVNSALSFSVANPGPSDTPLPGEGQGEFSLTTPAPTLTGLGDSSIAAGSGDLTMIVTGTNFFSGVSYVRWDASADFGSDDTNSTWDLPTTVLSNSEAEITIPAADLAVGGTHQITVRSRAGGISNELDFTVNNPAPLIFNTDRTFARQDEVSVGGGQNPAPPDIDVNIYGSGFVADPNAPGGALTTVTFNGVKHDAAFISSTQIRTSLGYNQFLTQNDFASTGTFDLTVTNPGPGGGTSDTVEFTVLAPLSTIYLVDPDSAPAGGTGGPIFVEGTNFLPGATVQLAGQDLPTSYQSPTGLEANVPASAITTPGVEELRVVNGDGQLNVDTSGTASDPAVFGILSTEATITGFNPASLTAGSPAQTLTIQGDLFQSGDQVQFNGQPRTTVYFSGQKLTIQLLALDLVHPGQATIKVIHTDGKVGFSMFTITATAPLAVNDQTYVIGSGTASESAANGVLAGDTGPGQLAVTAGTQTGAQGGTFVINADGSFTYTPGASFFGDDSTQITVTDASGDQRNATVNVVSQHAGVVWKFYESVLNRAPDAAGLQYWTQYFNNGGNTGDMAYGFFESDELLDKVVSNYYQQFLLRPLDADGLTYWKGVWHATGGPEQIKAGFADSPEFFNSSGATPDSWIDALYQRILSRTPDPDGKSFWLNYYQQQSAAGADAGTVRYNIAIGFFDSAESFGQDIAGWFQEYLFRTPTTSEQSQYVSQMQAGASDRTIEQAITNLPEYASNPPSPADGTASALPDYYLSSAPSPLAAAAAKDALFSQS